MPHCRLGQELKVGDKVIIEGVVEAVQTAEDYCNVTIRTAHPMPPYTEGTALTLNTKQVMSVSIRPEEGDE